MDSATIGSAHTGHAAPGATQGGSGEHAAWDIVQATRVESLHRQDVIRACAELFLAVVGILYATGFLVAFTFFQRFGVREAGTEFLKLKYIYIGILYFLFPVTVMLPLAALWGLWTQAKQERQKNATRSNRVRSVSRGRASIKGPPVSFVTILLLANMAFVFYVFICFAPVMFIQTRPGAVSTVCVPTILGILLFRFLETRKLRRRLAKWDLIKRPFLKLLSRTRGFRRRIRSRDLTLQWPWRAIVWWKKLGGGRSALFLGILLLDNRSIHGLWRTLGLMFWGDNVKALVAGKLRITGPVGGFYYYLFVFLYCLVAYRTVRRLKKTAGPARTRVLLAGCGLGISLFVASVLTFALRVHPFIPANKGGGDYTRTAAGLVLKVEHQGLNLPEAVVIIEETESSLFVAIPAEPPIPKTENIVAEGKWRLWEDLPTVIEIPREAVAYMYYWPAGKGTAKPKAQK